MLKIGVTGAIGAGKSLFLAKLEAKGYTCFSADKSVSEAYGESAIWQKIQKAFPELSLSECAGQKERAKLAAAIFESKTARSHLENIIHPYVKKALQVFIKENEINGAFVCFAEIPLLFEAGWNDFFDHIILLTFDQEARYQQLIGHRKLEVQQIQKIDAAQLPEAQKKQQSDIVLENFLLKSEEEQDHLLKEVLKKIAPVI